jgi:hypothetical protein
MYATPRVASGLCRTLLLKSLENIPSAVGNGESKVQDILKTWKKVPAIFKPCTSCWNIYRFLKTFR